VAAGVRAGELFEKIGILDGGADLVVAGGPLAEVEDAAAVGAEGEVFVGGEDDLAAGGAEEGFGHSVSILRDACGGRCWGRIGGSSTSCDQEFAHATMMGIFHCNVLQDEVIPSR
jgi:hypothetical protein